MFTLAHVEVSWSEAAPCAGAAATAASATASGRALHLRAIKGSVARSPAAVSEAALPEKAHGLREAGGIPALNALHAGLREERPLPHDPDALGPVRTAQPAAPTRLAQLPRDLHLVAPLQLDNAAHDVGGAGRRLHEAERPAGLAEGHVRVAEDDPVGDPAAADGLPLLVRRAPPLRRVARPDALVRAVARDAGSHAQGVGRLLGVADVDGRPERTAVGLLLGVGAPGAGGGRLESLSGLGRQRRVFGHDQAGRQVGRTVGAGRKLQLRGSGRRRKEGCGACEQNRWGGKSWHYAWYIGAFAHPLERGRLKFVMDTTLV